MGNIFSIVTIFPDMVNSYLGCSILRKAIEKGAIDVTVHDLRAYSSDRHKSVDDYPYGGGPGMVMKPEPFFDLIEHNWPDRKERKVIMLSPQGRVFDQGLARELAAERKNLTFLCGRYEAIDERVRDNFTDLEISIGDYVLTGGELPALVIIDAVSRLLPGVLGDMQSAEDESFSRGLLDFPHYTRPEVYRGLEVPKVLLSGNHAAIRRWRLKESLKRTMKNRPDLFDKYSLNEEELKLMDEIKEDEA